MTNFYGIFKCCWLKNTFEHTSWYALAIWLGTMNVANADTEGEMLPMSLDEAFNSGGIYILSNDIVINSKIVVSSNNGIEIQLNDYNISAAHDYAANNLFLVENDGVLILSGKEPTAEEFKTADKNSVAAGNNADILNVDGGQVKLSNLTLKDSKSAAIVANSAIFQAINTTFANMNNGAVKNAGNATFSGKNDFVKNSVATGNGGALNLEKESETKFSDSSLFENNTAATGNGGAIYGDGSVYLGDQNKLISAVFTNNTAKDGGAVFVDENGKFVGYGEFIFGQDSAANGNKATNSGGAIYNKGQMSFVGFNGKETKSIMFAANQATNGGAIYNTGALDLNGLQSFIGNSANNSEDDAKGFGGAIYNTGNLNIYGTNVEFSNNTAQKAGGAIYNNGGVVNISGSGILFNNNEVLETGKVDFNWTEDAKEGFGGAIANMEGSRLNISGNVTFSENGKDSKIAGGGAVYNRGYMTISGTRITKDGRDTTEDGRDTTDSYKHAAASIVFKNNVASKGIGGAIEAKGSHSGKNTVALSVIRGVNFIGNSSNADKQGDSRAGAIRANNDSITILDNVVFMGNSSKAAGGAISTANNLNGSALGTFISISNAYFEGNSVNMNRGGADGGAIRTGGALSMTNVQFVNNENKTDLDGAALSFDGTSLLLVADNGNVLFKGNIAKKDLPGQSSSGIHIDGKDEKKIMFNAGNGGEVIFFDKIVNNGTGAGANLTLELNKSNVLNATSTQLEQIYAKFFDAGGAYIGPTSKDVMQKTILGAKSVYWLSKEEAAAAGRLEEWNNLHEVEGIETAPTDGKIIFNTQISNTSLNLHNGELLLADEITDEIRNKQYITGNSNLNLYGGKLDVSNNNIESKGQLAFNKINVEGEAELNLDIDILNNKIDYLGGENGITGTDKGKLVISEIGILNEDTNLSLGDGSELVKFTGRNEVKTELSKMTQVIVTSNAGYYFTLDKADGSDQNNAVKLYKVLSGGGLGVALDSGSEFGISMKQSGGVEIVNWAEKYNIYDPKTGKTYSNMVGTNVQKGAVFTLKGEKESVVKAGTDANNKVGIVVGTKKFGADGKVYTLAMNNAANDIKDRETSAGRNTWYTYNKNETTGIREEGAEVADMSGTIGQNLNISNIKFDGFDTAITNYETGVINLENVGFSNNTLDIYNLGTLNLKGKNTFTNGIGGKDSLGVMSIINGKTISNSEINQQKVSINDIASLTVDADHLKSVTTNNGELNLGKGTLAYKVTGAGKTYISAGTEANKNKFSLADNVTIKQNSFSVLKNADAENVKGGKIIADTIKIAESGALSTKVGEHLQGNIDNHGTLTLFGSGDKSVTELFNNVLVDSYGEKNGKLVIDANANIKANEQINQNTMVNNGTFYADINKLAIEDKNSGITNDGVLYLNGSTTNESAAQNNLITTVRGNGVLYLSNNVVNTQNITQKKIHLIDNANVEAENDSTLKAKIKLNEGTKLAIKAENLISNKPADEIDGNWIDVENDGSLNLSGNLLNVVIGKAEDNENGGLVNINSSISFGENGEIRNNTVNIKNDGVGLTANADKITNGVIYVNNNSLTLTGGTNTNIIRKNFTPKAETTLGGTTYIGNSLNAANVINKEKIETDLFISNRANLTSELADLSGKISIGNLGALTLAKDAVLAENRKIYGKGNVIIGNNSLVMKNNSSIEGMLYSDNGTLNLAYDNASVTDAVSIGALGGNLNLAIKMALSDLTENKGRASSLKINNDDALANKNSKIILSNINLTKGFLETTPDGTSYSKFVTVVDGDLDNITFGFTDGDVMKSTDGKYIYDFTWNNDAGGKGKLDVKGIKIGGASGLPMFVKGSDYFGDVAIYQMSDSLVYSSLDGNAIGTTFRTGGNSKNLILNMGNNNLVANSKDSENNNILDGITVAGGYTFNANASNTEADKGIISGFKTAFEVLTGGILNINNVKFENNTDDVKNEGTVNLAENVVLNAISGVDGILNILDSADVTAGSIKQKLLVNNGTLTISADNLQTAEAVENKHKLNLTGGNLGVDINGLGTTNFSNNNTLNDNVVVSQAKIINSGILDATKGKLNSDDVVSTGTLKLKGDITASQVISGGKNDDGGLLKFGTLELSDSTISGDVVQDKIILSGTVTNNKNMIFNNLKNNGIFSTLANSISGDLTNDINAELNLNGGTLNANVSGGKTNINGDVVLASSSKIAASAVNVAENKSLTIAAADSSWNNAISGKGTTIFGADFDGNNNAVIETLLTNNGVLTSNTANIKGNVSNNNKLTLNSTNDVFDNTITGSGDLTLNGFITANKTISQKSITNNGSLTANADIIGAVQNNGTLNSSAENIKTSVTNKTDAELNLNGGTLNAYVSGGKTNINGDVVLASSSKIAASAVNVAENKSLTILTIAEGNSWNNAISGKGTTIFGADFDGNNNAVIETLLTNNGVLTSNTANIKGNVSNNNKLTLNSTNDVFDNTITGSGDLTLNGVLTANKTISQKSITNNGTLNSSIDNLNGELINTGIFNVAGENVVLNKNIAGEGTTVLENKATLKFGDSGKIEGVLKTNGATLDLQDTANKYTDVKIGAISGDLKLKIDADLSNASSDALELTSSNPSNGNILLSSINVKKDGDKSITFLKGNIGGITSKLDASSTISTVTNDYTYTFGISGNNKLDVLSAVLNTKPNTLKDFITGNLAVSADTYSMTKDINITSAENDNFGTTAGVNTKLNLNLNGHNLNGTVSGVKKDGIAVGNRYTLNINGTDGTVRGNIRGFNNALKVENGGTLNIANTVLNNDTDINNQGTLYADNISANKVLTTSNAVIKNSNITDLENKGTATLKGTNDLTNITEAGNLIVNDGKTTVSGKLEQNSVTVANNAVLEAVLDKFVVSSNTINNGVLNLFGNGAINKDITGNGSLNLDGMVVNNAVLIQKDLALASGKFTNSGTISVIDSMNVNGDMTNNGSVSAKDLIVSGNFANKANAEINGVLTLKENTAATAENNGIITGGVIVENNRVLTNNNFISGKVNVGNNGKILGNSGVMNITETSENNGEINQYKFTISNTGGFVNKGVLTSAVLENNNNLINSNKITAAMLKNNGNIDNTNGTIEGVITNENIINGGKIIANDGSVNNKTINADLTSKGKFTNKGNIAGTVTNTGLFSNAGAATVIGNILSSGNIDNSGIIKGNVTSGGSFKNTGIVKGTVTNNGNLTSSVENIMGMVINNGTYKTSSGIMNYDINGTGNTEINGNVVLGTGMFGTDQSVNITSESLLDIGAKTVSVNDLKLNGTIGLEITNIADKSSDYVGGKLLANNVDLSGGKIQFTVNQGLLNKKEQTGDLSIISLKSGASGSVIGDLTKVFEKNNRYEIIQGTKNGTVIIKNIASSSDVASLVGNRNNKNTAAAWENATFTSGTEAADIQKNLNILSQHNAQGYRRALNELAPSDSQLNLETVRLVQNIIGRETGERFEKNDGVCSLYRPASMWVKGIGASHYMDMRTAAQGFNADTAGYALGYDGNVDCDTSVGFGYAYTNTKGYTNSRKSSISAQNMFVYGKYQPSLTYVRGAFIYGFADYEDKTSVAGYGISSKYNMHSVGAETALGHEYPNGLNPEVGLRYTHLMPNDYTDSINQKIENENITAFSAFAKLKYKAEVKTNNQILFKPAIYIGANYDLNNSSNKINVAVANSKYTISSEPMSRFGFNGGLELAVSHENVDLILGYDLNLHTKYNAHSGQIQFRYNF